MWSRVIEFMLGIWLWMSPFIFRYSGESWALWVNDYVAGGICMLLGILSYWHPTRHFHIGNVLVSAWLIGFAYFQSVWPVSPAFQNHVLVGLLLVMFAVVPNRADEPPSFRRKHLHSTD